MRAPARCLNAILALAATVAVPFFLPGGLPSLGGATKVDEDKLYYGDVRKYSRPAVVEAARVYRQIAAHQEIVERKLTRDDPDYWPLMRKASQAFVRALRKACKEKGYDLVGELRTISIDGASPPDMTADVIKALDKKDLGKAAPSPPRKKDREKDQEAAGVQPGEGTQIGAAR